jgi:hypothetical protein
MLDVTRDVRPSSLDRTIFGWKKHPWPAKLALEHGNIGLGQDLRGHLEPPKICPKATTVGITQDMLPSTLNRTIIGEKEQSRPHCWTKGVQACHGCHKSTRVTADVTQDVELTTEWGPPNWRFG